MIYAIIFFLGFIAGLIAELLFLLLLANENLPGFDDEEW